LALLTCKGICEFLEAGRADYTIQLPTNRVLQNKIEYLLERPVGNGAFDHAEDRP
jgi:hypothetical protein